MQPSQSNPNQPDADPAGRTVRRLLIAVVALVTLIALFYTVENWRGKRAWLRCKHELEAKGEVLDWAAYIPPPLPDEQNVFKAPGIAQWFVGRGPTELSKRLGSSSLSEFVQERGTNAVAELTVVSSSAQIPQDADLTLAYQNGVLSSAAPAQGIEPQPPTASPTAGKGPAGPHVRVAPAARDQIEKLVRDVVRPATNAVDGPSLKGAQDLTLAARLRSPAKPVRIFVRADKNPSTKEVAEFFPKNAPVSVVAAGSRYQGESVETNSFRVMWNPKSVYSAADYLAWSDQFEPDFDLIREALKRPGARLDSDYQQPFLVPIPSFVTVRSVAQTLSQRAQCDLLLDRPDQALRELTLIHEMSHLLGTRPPRRPLLLVPAMVDVAVTGLYVQIIADGLRLHAWREPQLVALQEQLKQVDLLPSLLAALRSERAAVCHTFQTLPPAKYPSLLGSTGAIWKDPWYLFFTFAPRGWVYQNMARVSRIEQKWIDSFDTTKALVMSPGLEAASRKPHSRFPWFFPYSYMSSIALPNITKACQTLARNQTLANQALVVCALERYRLAKGDYPETLDALVPQFLEKLPHDLIGGQALKYRRINDAGFLLYSIGWNETDDGGKVVHKANGDIDLEQGDWVWQESSA